MDKRWAWLGVLGFVVLGACNDGFRGASPSAEAPPAETAGGGPGQPVRGPRARTMTLAVMFVTDDVAKAARSFRSAVRAHHGWVHNAQEDRGDDDGDDRVATFDVRVPATEIEAFRARTRRVAEIESETEQVEDVTEQQADLGARLRNARREEERLLALLTDRTASLADLVALEAKLAEVRERVERIDAQDRALTDRIAYVNVHAEIHTRPIAYWQRPGRTLARAGAWGVDAAAAVVVGAGAAIIGLGPTALVLLAVILGMVALLRMLVRRGSRAARPG